MSSPVWLWQLWGFVLPALHRNEKRWALSSRPRASRYSSAEPRSAYVVLPKAIDVLIGFVLMASATLVTVQ